jgi:hypothetical protein
MNEPIQAHEIGTIIEHLANRGKWESTRKGATVAIARFQSQTGCRILYSVRIGRTTVSKRARSVEAARQACNTIILERQQPEPLAGREADPNRTGTPHLVRRRNVEPVGESLLGEAL